MTKVRRHVSTKAQPKSPISPLLIGIVAGVALILVGGLIWLGNLGNQTATVAPIETANYPFMGAANAPVTMIDFSDYG